MDRDDFDRNTTIRVDEGLKRAAGLIVESELDRTNLQNVVGWSPEAGSFGVESYKLCRCEIALGERFCAHAPSMTGKERIDNRFLACIFPERARMQMTMSYKLRTGKTKPIRSFASQYNDLSGSGLQDE